LSDIRFGTAYRRQLDNDWIGGGSFLVGSPSDEPFASGDEIVVSATGFLRVPDGEHNAWLLTLNYANNRDFLANVPLPGAAYYYRVNDQLNVLAGIPMMIVNWQPTEKVKVEASYFIPRTIHAQVDYQMLDALKLYAGFDWTNQRFLRHDRWDDDDRLFYFEKRVALGARWQVHEKCWIDLAGGWVFDRFWFEGEDYGDRGDNRIDLSDGPVVQLQFALRL